MIDIDLTGMNRNLHKRRFDPSARVPGFDVTIQEMRHAPVELAARIGGPKGRAGLLTDPLRPWRGAQVLKLVLVFPPERSPSRATRLAALAGMITDPRWRDAITKPASSDLLAVFSTGRGDLVRVYSQKPRLAQLEFAVELALYGMFCSPPARA